MNAKEKSFNDSSKNFKGNFLQTFGTINSYFINKIRKDYNFGA